MTDIGAKEKATQQRVIALFTEQLGYTYLGDWHERENNANIEIKYLTAWLTKRGVEQTLITRALYVLNKAAADASANLYDRNQAVYNLLRYGIKVKPEAGANDVTVWLIDWEHPEQNDFAIAEEVTVKPASAKANIKRPDIVLYVNGIALGILELKRGSVEVSQGIRQNYDSQQKHFIQHFFSTMQLVMAGNDTEGLRYGTIETTEKYYLTWKEPSSVSNPLDRDLIQMCAKKRFLELIHDFVVFDAGTKKFCRHNQYFGIQAAAEKLRKQQGGIIWHTQGSGKSLTMVWLAKWIREHITDARVLIITDRKELDEQIEKVFQGVNETILRIQAKDGYSGGHHLISALNAAQPWLIASLVHKFGGQDSDDDKDVTNFIADIKKSLPANFQVKGKLIVFVDECHRTQSGKLHEAMKAILPGAIFIGFTGTPLLRKDKARSIEVFGGYIHTYKFHEAVADKVVLDLRYEARDIDQRITSQQKIDEWFEATTKNLTPIAKAELKKRWGTMQRVLSCHSRLEMIVADILMDMEKRDRLMSGHGNAILVAGSIYEACKLYELFTRHHLKGKCGIITSYVPTAATIKGEDAGEGDNDALIKYHIYRDMLADWFNEPAELAVTKTEQYEKEAKKKFIKEPGQMKLIIVVDKLLTGFDAPPCSFIYIDKQMQDHGLFQAICRVNRLDGEDKEYGYIIDYKDLFNSLSDAIKDYTKGEFKGFDKEDVKGLVKDRVATAGEHLTEALESIRALCEGVAAPFDDQAYYTYFSSAESGNADQLKANESKRLSLYHMTAALVRAYAAIAGEMDEAGFSATEQKKIKDDVAFYQKLRDQIKLHSGDNIDLKSYEPAMRHLIDTYIRADNSEVVSTLNDFSLIQIIVERGEDALNTLPDELRENKKAVAETIENNVRKLIIDQNPINPKYYEKMSALLDSLIQQRRENAISYAEHLKQIVELTKKAANPNTDTSYPATLQTQGQKALYDNLGKDEAMAILIDATVKAHRMDDWRGNVFKIKKVVRAIEQALENYTYPSTPRSTTRTGGSTDTRNEETKPETEATSMNPAEIAKMLMPIITSNDEY